MQQSEVTENFDFEAKPEKKLQLPLHLLNSECKIEAIFQEQVIKPHSELE